ncbi:Hypp2317 [Branchiostoma lanceolatum]|uniref:Hypp2317 protein n=1 Tax=Branchiostoma lanceolatum TaxID=7740 RepID=A0A8J9ZU76_BRALA|nr:Hypp2317 [Branchiostoma lanceolatum]
MSAPVLNVAGRRTELTCPLLCFLSARQTVAPGPLLAGRDRIGRRHQPVPFRWCAVTRLPHDELITSVPFAILFTARCAGGDRSQPASARRWKEKHWKYRADNTGSRA